MLHVIKTHAIEFRNMVIVKRIIDLPPLLAGTDQFHMPQSTQLMRYRGLGHGKLRRDITHVHLPFEQNGNDTQTRRVTEGAEQISQVCGSWLFE